MTYEEYELTGQYNTAQLKWIKLGIENNLDVTIYDNPNLLQQQMGFIYLSLLYELPYDMFLDNNIYTLLEMKIISAALIRGMDYTILLDKGYDHWQMEEILRGYDYNVDITQYAKKDYNAMQMHQIRRGLMLNLDISQYSDPAFNYEAMEAIRISLEKEKNAEVEK